MDEQEWLSRIDEHLETSKHYMREGNELMAHIDATLERNTGAFLDLQAYLQQATTILGALVAEIQGGQRESRAWRRESREWQRALADKLDRLSPEPPPSAA